MPIPFWVFGEPTDQVVETVVLPGSKEYEGRWNGGQIVSAAVLDMPGVGAEVALRLQQGIQNQAGGQILPFLNQRGIVIPEFLGSTERWRIVGVTRNSADVPVGGCRVMIFDTGQMRVGSPGVLVAEGISDGSGNYALEVPQNTAYQATAYLPGGPDAAGITLNTLVPESF